MLSNRQTKILYFLLKTESFVSIARLAEMFDISQRSIQYDLQNIESFQDNKQFVLMRHKSLGVKAKTLDQKIYDSELDNLSEIVHLTKNERKTNILITLFEATQPLSSNHLAELMKVSRRTIVNDLKLVQQWLASYHLEMKYIQNKGFIINGEEEALRQAYANIVKNYFKMTVPYFQDNLFSEEELAIVRKTVIETLNEEDYRLVQSAVDGLVYHIIIAIHRLKLNYSIDVPKEEYEKVCDTVQYRISQKLKKNLEIKFDIQFSESEAIFITLHLLSSKISSIKENNINTGELEQFLNELIKQVSVEIGVDLRENSKLLNGLIVHIQPAIHRMKFNLVEKNPLKEDIKKQYKNVYDIVKRNIHIIEEAYDISFTEDEIAYMTVHFVSSIERISTQKSSYIKVVLLCGSGIGTSQLLKSKLGNLYPEFDVIDAYSIYQIDEEELLKKGVDYIISTVDCHFDEIPVVTVDTFLNKSSRDQLNQIVNQYRESKVVQLEQIGENLRELLPEHRITKTEHMINKDRTIYQVSDLLLQDNIIESRYADAIIKQMESFGPYMVISPHIALLHSDTTYVQKGAGFAMTYVDNGIPFGHQKYDPIKVIIVLATKKPHLHLKALGQLSQLLTDDIKKKAFLEGNIQMINQYINEISEERMN